MDESSFYRPIAIDTPEGALTIAKVIETKAVESIRNGEKYMGSRRR